MPYEILINATAGEVRAAVLNDGLLQELLVERAASSGLLGNIYVGRVVRVLPGMQAAFLDIGLERTAFLHVSDMTEAPAAAADIARLLREGDELTVQIVKEPLGTKGARLSTLITLPSRYVVLLPGRPGAGVSARIGADDERDRLRAIAETHLSGSRDGCILRTVAEGIDAAALQADLSFVSRLWGSITELSESASGVRLLHADLPLAVRVVRDLATSEVERISVDSPDVLARISDFVHEFMPGLAARLELNEDERPIFDRYAIDEEIDRALSDQVDLKSGGYLVIEQTESMTTVDVNTGAYVGRSDLEETVFRTNLEAAAALARQLRLRNLGGIIIIDFIDMQMEAHRRQVIEALEAALAGDHARTQISHVSPLGLVEMTRKRARESLEHVLCVQCPTCEGRGRVKSPATVCYEIFREILRQHREFPVGELAILAHDDVVELLLDDGSGGLADLEQLTGRRLTLRAQTMQAPDDFEVVHV